ncbi:hypothetical protein GCM10010109_81190 [Actinoplanes campanulatus]|nr:hypothetical protein GCM10010109_81190 [Actinoplanes campanulatus]GID41173.1 hypothetical protein Aca09nite_76790 [Actinoplanes campanulatus]
MGDLRLTGLLICDVCGRRLSGHWVNNRAGYRCRHGHTSAQPASGDAPRWVYRSEARLVEDLIASNPELGGLADAGDVAAYPRARDMVVVCGHGAPVLEDTAGEPEDRLGFNVSEHCRRLMSGRAAPRRRVRGVARCG